MSYEHSEQYWEDYKAFNQLIDEIVRKEYSDDHFYELYNSANKLIGSWKETVESGEDYNFTIFEWDNEISVRETIECIFQNAEVQKLNYFCLNFKTQINHIDDYLMRITLNEYERPHCKHWWEKRILRGGQDEYKEHILKFYNIDLDAYQGR